MNPARDLTPRAAPAGRAAQGHGPMQTARWQLRLLGGLWLSDGAQQLTRLPSRAVTALLARLAMAPLRLHPREELVELLWPGVEASVGRNRLRQALSTLRSVLEPAGAVPATAVLLADRLGVRMAPGALDCDVPAFELALQQGRVAEARTLYRGELLPGFYDDWIAHERLRLAALAEPLADMRSEVWPGALAQGSMAAPAPADQTTAPATTTAPSAPQPSSTHAPRVSLPAYLTRLFGADEAIARLQAQVRRHRLVTLRGPGGAGKTRLAVETARALADAAALPPIAGPGEMPAGFDRIVFVPWVACRQRDAALGAVAAALGLALDGGDALVTLAQALAGQRTLLLLDNAEQLAGEIEPALAQLLGTLPTLHALVTSRRALGLDGEREIEVAALALPPPGAGLAAAAANPAVALFVERAQAVRADFHLGARNAPVLAALVHALHGMPLAIELAAARLRSVAPAEMLERLRGPGTPALDLLARGGPRGTHDPRHASMLRTLEWSWQLLDAPQRRLLALLTLWAGSFDAAAVPALAGTDALDAAARLDDLVASSLVQRIATAPGDGMRFQLDPPLREYAAQQLDAEAAWQGRERLRQWALRWAEALPRTPPLPALRAEMPNLVAAMASAVHDGMAGQAVALLLALGRALEDVALPAEGLAELRQALPDCADAGLRARGQAALAALLYTAGDASTAVPLAEAALRSEGAGMGEGGGGCDAAAVISDPAQRARLLHAVARVRWRSQRRADGVLPLLDRAQALLDATGLADPDPDLQGSLHALRGFIANHHGRDRALGEHCHALALACWERGGNAHAIASGRYNLAVCALNAGRPADALARLAPVITAAQAQHDHRRLSQCLNLRGDALAALRRWPEAVADFRACLRVAWQALATFDLAHGLWNLPRSLAHLRQPEDAARLMGFAEAFWRERYGDFGAADRHDLRRLQRLVACQLGAARAQALRVDGRQLTLAEAVALATG